MPLFYAKSGSFAVMDDASRVLVLVLVRSACPGLYANSGVVSRLAVAAFLSASAKAAHVLGVLVAHMGTSAVELLVS